MSSTTISQETEILSRVIGPENPNFSPEAARSILALGFGDTDNEQMNYLRQRPDRGPLTSKKNRLLNAYMFVGAVVDLMHSKARLSLKKNSA